MSETGERLRKLWEEEETLSRRLLTVRGLIAREQEIFLLELFAKIQESIRK